MPGPDRSPSLGRALGLLTIPALVAVSVFALVGGAVAAYAIGDPGAVVRWSVPLARTVRDLAGLGTIGLLLVGGFLIPETTRTTRRATAARLAGRFALAWLAATLVAAIGEFGDLSGLRPTDHRYWSEFFALAWELPTVRNVLISAAVVAVIALLCQLSSDKVALAWGWIAGLLALMPLALTGHSAVGLDHMSGVNALAVHLVAATTWAGGLLGLLLLRGQLGPHLAVSAARYSVVAGWAYAALGLSGLLAAVLNLSGFGDLLSPYGAMLLTKVAAFLALGAAGWWHRRRTLDQLRADPEGGAFTRLALGELALMGLAVGTAVALARTAPPASGDLVPDATSVYRLTGYPDPGPPPANAWVSAWTTDWLWVSVAVVAIGLYAAWVIRLHRRGDRWPLWKLLCWTLGWLVFVYATCGAPGVYGRVMFSWHMIMHMTIAMVVPLLLVPAAPITLALRALPSRPDKTLGPREVVLGLVHSRVFRVTANPAVAAALFFFSLATFYFTPLFEAAMTTHTGHILMTVHFLLSGYLFAWVLIGTDPGPRRWSPLALLVVLFATISFHAFFGVAITGGENLLAADFFKALDASWLPNALADQQRGGAIAWGVGEAPTLVLAMIVVLQWVQSDNRETRRLDRQADRDGDAELAAYNADLARRAAAQKGGTR